MEKPLLNKAMEKAISNKTKYTQRYDQMDKGDGCEDFIESLQCAIVRAGGCFKPRSELEKETIGDLVEMLSKNNIAAVFMEEVSKNENKFKNG
jgi:hypothetical protein